MLNGIAAAKGYGLGKAFIVKKFNSPSSRKIVDIEGELKRLENAIKQGNTELEHIYNEKKEGLGENKAAIFQAHIAMLKDPELIGAIKDHIQNGECAEYAAKLVCDQYYAKFSSMEDTHFKERALDVKDIGIRLMKILMGIATGLQMASKEPVIIVAKDLTPSDTASLKAETTAGIITEIGGATSHTGIIAEALGIPAVMGLKNATALIKENEWLFIDGHEGIVVQSPSREEVMAIENKIQAASKEKNTLQQFKDQPSLTSDGQEIQITSNIASLENLAFVEANGSDGIGLFRSEFIYMNRQTPPSEEDQYAIYKKVLESLKGKPIIIRTLDAGGDKEIPYLAIPKEMNPFLGYRAIRYCLDHKELFATQIRALLRAGVHGKLRIMFPMISSLEELQIAKKIVVECQNALRKEDIPYDKNPEIGIMIEIPSAAIISDILAEEVDFFSIGTNDLTQYTVAVDRMNQQIKHLYTPYHPALIRLVKLVIDNGHAKGKWVGMCGAVASDAKMIPLLLHLGLDEFSMSPSAVLKARQIIANCPRYNNDFVQRVLKATTAKEVEAILSCYYKSVQISSHSVK